MNRVLKITQAYSQTPWRKQVQGIGMFLSLLVISALVAVVYLSVTSRTATIGREIQYTLTDIETLQQGIAEKQAYLAEITATAAMQARARELGFLPVKSTDVHYLVIPGYRPPAAPQLAPQAQPTIVEIDTLSPAFTQSLFDWVKEQVYLPPATLADRRP